MLAEDGKFGKAINVEGEVKIRRRFKIRDVKVSDELLVKDRVTTGPSSTLEIEVGPKNNIKIDQNSKMTLTREKQDNEKDNIIIELMAGTLRSKLDQLEGQAFTIRSPVAVAGVRGTDLVTAFDPTNASAPFKVTNLEGSVAVSGIDPNSGELMPPIILDPGEQISSSLSGQLGEPIKLPPAQLKAMKTSLSVKNEEPAGEEKQEKKQEKKKEEEDKKEEKKEEKKEDSKEEKKSDSKSEDTKDNKAGSSEDSGGEKSNQESAKTDNSPGADGSSSELKMSVVPDENQVADTEAPGAPDVKVDVPDLDLGNLTEDLDQASNDASNVANEVVNDIVQEVVDEVVQEVEREYFKLIINPAD